MKQKELALWETFGVHLWCSEAKLHRQLCASTASIVMEGAWRASFKIHTTCLIYKEAMSFLIDNSANPFCNKSIVTGFVILALHSLWGTQPFPSTLMPQWHLCSLVTFRAFEHIKSKEIWWACLVLVCNGRYITGYFQWHSSSCDIYVWEFSCTNTHIQGAYIFSKKVHFLHTHFSYKSILQGGVFCNSFTVNVNIEVEIKGLLE